MSLKLTKKRGRIEIAIPLLFFFFFYFFGSRQSCSCFSLPSVNFSFGFSAPVIYQRGFVSEKPQPSSIYFRRKISKQLQPSRQVKRIRTSCQYKYSIISTQVGNMFGHLSIFIVFGNSFFIHNCLPSFSRCRPAISRFFLAPRDHGIVIGILVLVLLLLL